MRKLCLVLLLFVGSVWSVPTCNLTDTTSGYTCELTGVEVDEEITAVHNATKEDANVENVIAKGKFEAALVTRILKKFGGLKSLVIEDGNDKDIVAPFAGISTCNLQTIKITKSNTVTISNAFPNCRGLKSVEIIDSKVKTTNVNTLSNQLDLEMLNLARNAIDLTVTTYFVNERFTNLIHLNLASNNLASIPDTFALPAANLKTLDLSGNTLSGLRTDFFLASTKLEEIYLQNNQLSIDEPTIFAAQRDLLMLRIANNKVIKLASNIFTNNGKMTHLDISSIDKTSEKQPGFLDPLVKLQHLSMADINFSDSAALKTSLAKLTKLTRLNIAANPVELSSDFFNANVELEEIYLDKIPSLTGFPENVFSNNTKLKTISASNNTIEEFDANLIKHLKGTIKTLDLSGNKIKKFYNIDELKGLTNVKLTGNECINRDYETVDDAAIKELHEKCGAITIIVSNILLLLSVFITFFKL